MKRRPRPVRITDAAPSQNEQLHRREVRYVVMMSFRAVCLILATILASAHVPYLGIWIPLLLVATLLVPWLAVILANDRAPRSQYRLAKHQPDIPEPRALTGANDTARTIDADP